MDTGSHSGSESLHLYLLYAVNGYAMRSLNPDSLLSYT